MQIFAVFDAEGRSAAFYPADVFDAADIPAGAVPISPEQWADWLDHQGQRRWDGAAIVPVEAPAAAVQPAATCAKLGLLRALREKGDWPRVKAALAQSEELQEDWDAATVISRADPLTAAMIATMGYSDADVAALIARANALAVT